MPDTPDDPRFGDGFLDDFFAEADEHLTSIRRNLLALEAALPSGSAAPATLEEMFRSFHSLKGISGMVQLEKAELLAHEMESHLRALRGHQLPLTAGGVEALIDGTRMLEEVIAARREHRGEPDIGPIRSRLAALTGGAPTPADHASSSAQPARSDAPPRAGEPPTSAPGGHQAVSIPSGSGVWRLTFVPSSELLARGINVNVVRERLREVGEILDARPKVLASGGIAFDFTIVTQSGPETFEAWRDDGISYERANARPHAEREPAAGPAAGSAVPAVPAPTALPAPSRMVRVDLSRLDDVMSIVADLVVARTRLDEAVENVEDRLPHGDWRPLEDASRTLERQMRLLRDAIMRVRLVRVGEIFGKMPFVVRDLARDTRKQVRLDLRGQDTEIDKFLIERMMDPIVHLVRNAITHGIEPPEERVARRKPPAGTIGLHATTVGEWIVIEVEDDGCGIDPAAIAARAREAHLPVPPQLDAAALLELLCRPGFSMRQEADRAAGRGVGMAVVQETVRELSGTIELDTEPGRGTRFVITLPVTLAIIDALICRVNGQRFALPQGAVHEVVELDVQAARAIARHEIFRYRGAVLPLVHVSDLLGLARTAGQRVHVCVVGTGTQAVGLGVDRVLGQREIVVRPMTDPLMRIEGLSGATELGDGQPVLILDPLALVRMARRRSVEAGG